MRIFTDGPAVAYATSDSAGFDIPVSGDYYIRPGELVRMKTGLVIESPPGCWIGVLLRSSTPKRWGLMIPNGMGVIDEDYNGPDDEIQIQVVNFTRNPVSVPNGTVLAQGIIFPRIEHPIEMSKPAENWNKSRGGFGSTDDDERRRAA